MSTRPELLREDFPDQLGNCADDVGTPSRLGLRQKTRETVFERGTR